MSFAGLFSFSRRVAAPYLDQTGAQQMAAVDQPRFDHHADGTPRGLLIQGPPELWAADRATLDVSALPTTALNRSIVLHEYEQPGGAIMRRALWAPDTVSVVNALLNAKGWHRQLYVIDRLLAVVGGTVGFSGVQYPILSCLSIDGQTLLGVGDAAGSILIGGA